MESNKKDIQFLPVNLPVNNGIKIKGIWEQWLKETGRSGSVITGKSMQEFFDWFDKKYKVFWF